MTEQDSISKKKKDTDTHGDNHMETQGERTIRKPRREAAGGADPADTLILDFLSPGIGEIKFLLLKPPSLWYFVTAALSGNSLQADNPRETLAPKAVPNIPQLPQDYGCKTNLGSLT